MTEPTSEAAPNPADPAVRLAELEGEVARLEDLLPALDSLALGLESASTQSDGRAVAEGFRMAVGQLRGILSSQGLVEVNPTGQPFDPARHEAVGSEASATVAEGTVLRVARAGWLLHDRVLRPAAVFVSSGPAQ
jgi:molecular chaperone GrpE